MLQFSATRCRGRHARLISGIALLAGSAASAQFVECNASSLYTLAFGNAGDNFGWAVADLADIDGDGFTDIITGAPFNDAVGINAGVTFVYSGATGALIHQIDGAAGGELMGYAISDAGDIDGDGVNDIVSGGPFGNGRVRVYSGDDASVLREWLGPADARSFGAAVAGIGDVNGDTVPDILIGASNPFSVAGAVNQAYVYSGADGSLIRNIAANGPLTRFGAGTAALGDISGDGVPDYVIGAPDDGIGRAYVYSGADGSLLFPALEADPTGADFGTFFVGPAGDTDTDGVNDVYVGDFSDDGGRGRAYVFSGVDGARLHTFVGATAGDGLGPGRRAGDINGDGFDDIVVGAYTNSDGASFAGKLIIYSGADGSILRTITSTAMNALTLGFDAVGVGDVTGDGRIDF
ncbi:MAG: integrin alpha, partial [Planctomycetota bacterium]|nr:integrin alpha [Planctomycetota bacterium]